jgi:hypothetical protein
MIAGGALVALLVIVADGYWQAYRIGRHLEATYPKLKALRTSLAQGRIPNQASFAAAQQAVAALHDRVSGARFTFGLTGAIPLVGRPVKAVRLGAAAMDEVGKVSVLADGLVRDLFGRAGRPSHLFSHGRVDVERLSRARPLIEAVPGHLRAALADVQAIPHIPFFHRLDTVRAELLAQVQDAVRLSTRAVVGFKLLPRFLGADGPRRYLLAFQNNSDQRGTGGAVLAYGLIRVDHGRLRLVEAGPIQQLDRRTKRRWRFYAAPSIRWYLHAVHRLPRINNGFNYSPNFREVGPAWARQVKKITGTPVDGAIALDPFAVAYALRGQGSFRVPDHHHPIDSTNLVRLVEHDQYSLSRHAQLYLPGELIQGAFRLLTNPRNPLALAKNLGTALFEKRAQAWFRGRVTQRLLRQMGWDGGLYPGTGDFLYLVQDKRNINKVDYFTRQFIGHTVSLLPSGEGRAVTTIRLVNDTPPGQSEAVVGPWRPYGLNVTMLNLYVPKRSDGVVVNPFAPLDLSNVTPVGYLLNITPRGFVEHVEGNTRVYTKHVEAWSGHPAELSYRYDIPFLATRLPDGTFEYALTFRHQPQAKPGLANVTVHLPKGSRVLGASPLWTVRGDSATFRGPLIRDVQASIHYELQKRS